MDKADIVAGVVIDIHNAKHYAKALGVAGFFVAEVVEWAELPLTSLNVKCPIGRVEELRKLLLKIRHDSSNSN